MRKTLLLLLWCLANLLTLESCDTSIKGDLLPNQPPKTYTVVDSVYRSGEDRFTSTVVLNWWGNDPDGFVTGYEFTFEENPGPATQWIYTTRTDSTFLLTVPAGLDTFDFRFSVRAIDNEGLRDPQPATVKYPVKNSPPTVEFLYPRPGGNPLAGGFPQTSYPAIHYQWIGNDPDGITTLDRYELVFNDTNNTAGIFSVSATFTEVILRAENLSGAGSSCLVYPGENANPLTQRMEGMVFEDSNFVYVRAIDQSGAESAWQRSKPTYIKRPTSSLLLVNAYGNDPNPDLNAGQIGNIYQTELNGININTYDELRIFQRSGNDYVNLSANNRTQALVFGLFDQILWIGPDFDISIVFAQNTLGDFLNEGGRVMLSLASSLGSPVVSNFYEFSPIDSLQGAPAGFEFLLGDTSSILPGQSGFPTLRYRGFTSSVRPIKFVAGVQPLYRANILIRGGANPFPPFPLYAGNNVVMGMRENTTNNSKFIITTLELHRMNNNGNLGSLLDRILKTEFGL